MYAPLAVEELEHPHPRPRRFAPRLPRGAPRVSVVVPTLNEAANLPHVLPLIPSEVLEVLVVDGHSTDDTVEVARGLRDDVRVVLQNSKGKGNALACGFAAARGEIIVMLDADGSTDPREIPAFVQALMDGADFAKGTRFGHGGGSEDITWHRHMGNHVLNGAVNVLFRTRYTDLCYGYNAFWVRCLKHMQIDCDGFEVETLMNVRIARSGMRIQEVGSVELARIHGESKLHPMRDGLRVLRTIVGERMRAQPEPCDISWRPEFRELPTTPVHFTGDLALATA
jgi:glycosyltransferase involved in cell wall biosynthesis